MSAARATTTSSKVEVGMVLDVLVRLHGDGVDGEVLVVTVGVGSVTGGSGDSVTGEGASCEGGSGDSVTVEVLVVMVGVGTV